MPKLIHAVPKYRHHKASGKAVVTIQGRDIYLGEHGTETSKAEYDRIIGEWLAAGRPSQTATKHADLLITELVAAYWKFAQGYYVKNGEPSGSIPGIKVALRILKERFGNTPAIDFGPSRLKAIQVYLIDAGQSRRYLNDNIDRIKRVFKWAVSEELLPVCVLESLRTVSAIRKDRSKARETDPIPPVPDEVVESTLISLSPIVADMVRFQRLTGCRPGEVCTIRPMDIEKTENGWIYRPNSHKTQHLGKLREIVIGPRACRVLQPYLERDVEAYCFSPQESEELRNELRSKNRKTPQKYGNCPGSNRKQNPAWRPGRRYTAGSYRTAIQRVCRRKGILQWSPNQLRHTAATEIRSKYGLEAAQVVLGHSSMDVTQLYAERDVNLATTIMADMG